jgi:hypothetical protein
MWEIGDRVRIKPEMAEYFSDRWKRNVNEHRPATISHLLTDLQVRIEWDMPPHSTHPEHYAASVNVRYLERIHDNENLVLPREEDLPEASHSDGAGRDGGKTGAKKARRKKG